MKKSFRIIVSILIIIGIAVSSFTEDPIRFRIPAGFPRPHYTFKNNRPGSAGFALGRKLFYDPVLSLDSSTSCGSCHQSFAAFAHVDHALSHGINNGIGTRNVPALQNLAWQENYMWDGRVTSLEEQPVNPITNPKEMGEDMDHVLLKLQRNPVYTVLFKNVFPAEGITRNTVLKALAQFTGMLISADSKYDQFKAGRSKFTASEKHGLQLFMEKCANCHEPPLFTDHSFRSVGLKMDPFLKDRGRILISHDLDDEQNFKVPSLRNVALTGPYMHDGRFTRLGEVMDHYGDENNFADGVDNSMYRIGKLSDKDKKDLIAFMLTLTDKNFVSNPLFAEPVVK